MVRWTRSGGIEHHEFPILMRVAQAQYVEVEHLADDARCQRLLWEAGGNNLACVHDSHMRGEWGNKWQVVQDGNGGYPKPGDDGEQGAACLRVEVIGWLIEKEDRRLLRKRPCELHPLPLAPGQRTNSSHRKWRYRRRP